MAGKSDIVRGALDALTDAYKKTFAPETYYHGTVETDIQKFNPGAAPSEMEFTDVPTRGATYFTSEPKYANEILEYLGSPSDPWPGSMTYPVKLKLDSVFDQDNPEHINKFKEAYSKVIDVKDLGDIRYLHLGDWEVLEDPNIQEALKDAGFRGYKVANEPGTVGLFYPDEGDVRSVFAKFDPKEAKSGNILASVPAAALATGALSELAEEE